MLVTILIVVAAILVIFCNIFSVECRLFGHRYSSWTEEELLTYQEMDAFCMRCTYAHPVVRDGVIVDRSIIGDSKES